MESLEQRIVLATWSVTVTDDSGPGSLRAAILAANSNPGPDRIEFQIPGSGVQTISLLSPLPAVSDTVELDGRTQPGYAGTPRIELNGTGAGPEANGLVLSTGSGSSLIAGLSINRFDFSGILVQAPDVWIIGNFLGTDASGAVDQGNGRDGVEVVTGGVGTRVGGSVSGQRNIISGNGRRGITIASSDVIVAGNYIGTDVSGNVALGNSSAGVLVAGPNAVIGGATPASRNVISGNLAAFGINITSGGNQTLVENNYVGLGADGETMLGNYGGGIVAQGTAADISILRNVISGNLPLAGNQGVGIQASPVSAAVIRGNIIGLNASGTASRPNNSRGVIGGAVIGGYTAAARNIISGNRSSGIQPIADAIITGNYIGTDITGTTAIPNEASGITVIDTANVRIGGAGVSAGNLISGNLQSGVQISGASSSGNLVQGNFIGTDVTGLNSLANGVHGVYLLASTTNNVVGGSTTLPGTGRGNVIAGNTDDGVRLDASHNFVYGNLIGLGADGSTALPNSDGIEARGGSNNTIGGSTSDLRNVISGNQFRGMTVNSGASANVIQGNYIGTDRTGIHARGNGTVGIQLGNVLNTLVGGPTTIPGTGSGNVISGNTASGLQLGSENSNSTIQGNLIGTGADGVTPLGNGGFAGVYIFSASGSGRIHVGGDDGLSGNVISANLAGVIVRSTLIDVQIEGNRIGTDVTGTIARGNVSAGIAVQELVSNSVRIGGSSSSARNTISANDIGVSIESGSTGAGVVGNFIGTTSGGTAALGNRIGVRLINLAAGNHIGGPGSLDRNLISGNTLYGIQVNGLNNVIEGNAIGTGVLETQVIGGGTGIIVNGTSNIIGGNSDASANILAGQQESGLRLPGSAGSLNSILRNRFFSNPGKGIDAGAPGTTLNDPADADGVANYPVLTQATVQNGVLTLEGFSGSGASFDIYLSAPTSDGFGQGRQWITSLMEGSATDLDGTTGAYGPLLNGQPVSTGVVNASRFRFEIPLLAEVSDGNLITALATGGTSEFSPALIVGQQLSQLVPDVTLSSSVVTLKASESLRIAGAYIDPDSTSWTATVDYGDGSGLQPLSLNSDNSFLLEYDYAAAGNYIVSVHITDNSLLTGVGTLHVNVENEAPVVTFNEFTYTNVVFEGQQATLSGKFEDQGGIHSVDVDWGDGTIATIPVNPGDRTFTATHVYRDDGDAAGPQTPVDVYRVVVKVTDDGGASAQTQLGLFLIEVINVRPHSIVAGLSSTSIPEGTAVTINTLTFVDPGMLDQHTLRIDWGDGTRTSLSLPMGIRSLSGLPELSHVYVNNPTDGSGHYQIRIEIADDDEPVQPAVLTRLISVTNVAPAGVVLNVSGSTVTEGETISLSGTFFDPGILDTHRIIIDWGDGTSNTVVNAAAGVQSFSGVTHTYRNNPIGGGAFTISVRVTDPDDPSAEAHASVPITVLNAAPVLGAITTSAGGSALLEGQSITIDGSFTDLSPSDRHTVWINWGDGSDPQAATVNSTTRTFTATHRYRDDSSQIVVTLEDQDGATDSVVLLQQVLNVAPTVSFSPDASNSDPNLISLHAAVSDPGILDTFVYAWSAFPLVSGPVSVQISSDPGSSTFTVNRSSHPSALWKVFLTVTDDNGGSGRFESVLLVGTNGDDTLVIDDSTFIAASTNTIMVLGLNGNDIIDGTNVTSPSHALILDGGAGADFLFGGAGNDTYILRGGDDNANVLTPGGPVVAVFGGNDRYVLTPNSTLTVIDPEGDNVLDFSLADFGSGTGITFDLSLISNSFLVLQDVSPDSDPGVHFVNIQGTFRELFGSRFGDTLTAASDSEIYGVGGSNQYFVNAMTANASIVGGADDDLLMINGVGISNLSFFGDDGLNMIQNFGSVSQLIFSGGADDDILLNSAGSTIASLSFFGDDGFNRLENFGNIVELAFTGGADNDLLINNSTSVISSLLFNGDDGLNQLFNFGQITELTFTGGADADVLINESGAVIDSLSFFGDDGLDVLRNHGTVTTLTFGGGADDDLLVNELSAQIETLSFFGDDGFNVLQNLGAVTSMTFAGGADDDLLLNTASGTILNLSFFGDDGFNELQNLGQISTLEFVGGADSDLLVNSTSAVISTLTFLGDDGFNQLFNAGQIAELIFTGGADDDLLVNQAGAVISTLNFGGDDGFNQLFNAGQVAELTFTGGADDDLLVNQAGAVISTLNFGGDDGFNQLLNSGQITTIEFSGGADSDLLINAASATVSSLNFFGDDGSNELRNLGTILNLNFTGGADSDLLVNDAGAVISTLSFTGDDGFNVLMNSGSVGEMIFSGGADNDVLLNHAGASVSTLMFHGDDGSNLLQNAGSVVQLTFVGGADDDRLINLAGAGVSTISFFGDDGANLLLNLSSNVSQISFVGGADDDVLWNDGSGVAILHFVGDDGQNLLFNSGHSVGSIAFAGGADNDVLISDGLATGSISFRGDSGSDTLIVRGSGLGTADSWIEFDGGAGIDAFRNDADLFHTVTFRGGADNDVLVNNGSSIFSIVFHGDSGNDLFENNGNQISVLSFTGDLGQDILVNDGSEILMLTFHGGADNDLFINHGSLIETLTFTGGADDDLLFNSGSRITNLTFSGDDGIDRLINSGSLIGTLTFHGGADNDILWNQESGTRISSLNFFGDSGSDLLINDAAGVAGILFNGGADDDVLQNSGFGIGEIVFYGDDGADVLINTGTEVQLLTFFGGADDDLLIQRGVGLAGLVFQGDDGADVLIQFGTTLSLMFLGGADDDILLNSGGFVEHLNFSGDDGIDILVNNGTVQTLMFSGGSDDDILQNNGPVVTLTFHGDSGNDTLINNFAVSQTLTFLGGADNDTLINNASRVAEMIFQGDSGNDTARINGRELGDLTFYGGAGTDTLIWNAVGAAGNTVTFQGGNGADFLAHRGTAGTLLFEGNAGDDRVLISGHGNLILNGGAGHDYYQFGTNPTGSVSIVEGYSGADDDSVDTLDFSAFVSSSIQVDLRSNTAQPQGTELVLTLSHGMGIENLIGTQYSDVLFGNARDNSISAAEFTELPSGPVAQRRSETQWVFLDFDSHTEPGEHIYTSSQREAIREQIERAYRGPDDQNPWFDVRVTLTEFEIPGHYFTNNEYVTIYFNSTPSFGRPGGLASEIDPGNFNLGGSAQVQINGMLGGIIQATGDGYEHGNPEEDGDRWLLKGHGFPAIRDDEVGALKPAATEENFVILSVKVAAHELAHLLGLRHHDAFGPIGMGIHDPPGSGAFKPVYGGPAGGFETFDHLIGSPASVGSTRFDDLKGLFFGEREAIKLAYGFADPTLTTITVMDAANHFQSQAVPLSLVTVVVPNTLQRGINQSKSFAVQLISVLGKIEVDSQTGRSRSDWYSFEGRQGDLINIDVFSNSIRRFATGFDGELLARDYVDTIVRVYDADGNLVRYYDGFAENDDLFEPTDSTLIDLILPADGIYYIEVDTFHRYGDLLGDPNHPESPLNPANPNNILHLPEDILTRIRDSFNDTDSGNYQLIVYRFGRFNTFSDPDEIKGFGGTDVILGGPGISYELDFDPGDALQLETGETAQRTIVLSDPGASDWSGSTVDYGDGNGRQTLAVDGTGVFTLNFSYTVTGEYLVTVIIVNDIGQTVTRTLSVTVTDPPNEAPTAGLTGPPAGVRGEPQFYTFTAFDADPDDADRIFVYQINWGDGSPIRQVTGGSDIELMHIFSVEGNYQITVTVTDARGLQSQPVTMTITVDRIQVRPDSIHPGKSVLVIGGGAGDDIITVHGTPGNQWLIVTINGEETSIRWIQDGIVFVDAIAVYGQDGNDILSISQGLSLPVLLDGGAGNDILTGGRGPNILIGGDGNDILFGFGGRDLLIGGRGSDLLHGGTGEDILIAGYTRYDQDRRALDAMFAEWNSGGSFATRRLRLMGELSGGLNGSYFIRPNGTVRTVFDDNELDLLWGSAGRDWLLLNTNTAEDSVRDLVFDYLPNDEEDDIDLFAESD